ncbi:ArsR/SmtB family transcription factor [Nonomuraea jiangxiensis]|uniref:DNA-binding transcriptional regulator, ArsR family n=1 Tax=Nonomuraea jiangxiensis TaxID=633440 RepID=A0A1G8LQ13_9ACTN|nr:helix-turn-helix transcriptional regulator [Nonomuraea jiangxiensis]SDI57778.1 DNA-binding transcriptional regulator, ArsR family [Nonomuraea jiangxiensis]
MRLLPHPATEDIQLTEVLRALADPVRLEIVGRLSTCGEMTCGDAGDQLGVHKSTASHHYRTLREAGVIVSKQEGRVVYISLRRHDLDARFPGLLDSILAASPMTAGAPVPL